MDTTGNEKQRRNGMGTELILLPQVAHGHALFFCCDIWMQQLCFVLFEVFSSHLHQLQSKMEESFYYMSTETPISLPVK